MMLTPVAIALGSNLGESLSILQQAIVLIEQHPEIMVIAQSHWYRTAPVGPPQPDYINGCILCQVNLDPEVLLRILLAIEDQFGRVRQERWGARTLDLDLLFYGDRQMDLPHLQIPHPRLQERAFVLVPLAEIAPDWIDPRDRQTVQQLLNQINPQDCHRL
jgi:2-amino-4-hydroxy-6-hydroxymethyldihydropteridine diphosphokinase